MEPPTAAAPLFSSLQFIHMIFKIISRHHADFFIIHPYNKTIETNTDRCVISSLFRPKGFPSASDSGGRNRQPTPVSYSLIYFLFSFFTPRKSGQCYCPLFPFIPFFRSQDVYMKFFVSSCVLTTFFTFSMYDNTAIKKYYCTARDLILLTCPESASLLPPVPCAGG